MGAMGGAMGAMGAMGAGLTRHAWLVLAVRVFSNLLGLVLGFPRVSEGFRGLRRVFRA